MGFRYFYFLGFCFDNSAKNVFILSLSFLFSAFFLYIKISLNLIASFIFSQLKCNASPNIKEITGTNILNGTLIQEFETKHNAIWTAIFTVALITIGIILLVLQLPFVKNYINDLYANNPVIRSIIDTLSNVFK